MKSILYTLVFASITWSSHAQNYVKTYVAQEEIPDDLTSVSDYHKVQESIQYLDGLGRPDQIISIYGSPKIDYGRGLPEAGDIIIQSQYDDFGRATKSYLPFVQVRNHGNYRSNALSDQENFHNNHYGGSSGSYAYTEQLLEASPLNRVLKTGAPGQDWAIDGDHTTDFVYHTNADYETVTRPGQLTTIPVKLLRYNSSTNELNTSLGDYNIGELKMTIVYDENEGDQEGETREFTDPQGRVILKQIKSDESRFTKVYASTQYVYDDFGNLRLVIPPAAMAEIESANNDWAKLLNEEFRADWLFIYEYDHRNRMVSKKIPGADWMFMVYDQRDRLILTQDGNQRSKNEWLFTKYDQFNRPILTGIYTDVANVERTSMQAAINNHFGGSNWSESRGNGPFEYTNVAFPQEEDESKYLTATYYDEYNFVFAADYPYVLELGNSQNLQIPKGQITGTKVKVLDETNTWLNGVNYYDERYRHIQAHTDIYTQGTDRATNKYDFSNNILESLTIHGNKSILRTFEYDHGSRLQKIWHEVFEDNISQGQVLLVKNEYNELNQLKDKSLHSVDEGLTFQQSIDYLYNIRGWLTSINKAELNGGESTNDDRKDYWGMELSYNEEWEPGIGNLPQFNGNISATKWSVHQGKAQTKAQSYSYDYDGLSRLTSARHASKSSFWIHNSDFKVQSIEYDANGNIQELERRDGKGQVMDELAYGYNGNQVTRVTDNGDIEQGFIDGNLGGDDYSYDASGNLVKDRNKKVTNISYNEINLPTRIDNENGEYLTFAYDAAGIKLSQSAYDASGGLITKTDYAGEFIYENNDLQFIQHNEGRIIVPINNTDNYEYQYHLKDHLGNSRLTFTTIPKSTEYLATMETDDPDVRAFEEAVFANIQETRHTFQGPDKTGNKVSMLNLNQPVGPAMSLEVMAGDVLNIETLAYYEGSNGNANSINSNMMIAAIAASFGGIAGGQGEAGEIFNMFNNGLAILGFGGAANDNVPAGYLNYLLFDKDMVYQDGGYVGISESANMSKEVLSFGEPLQINEPGYLFVYVTNESESIIPIYFDDLKIVHSQSLVIQSDDYYPYGLAFNSNKNPLTKANQFLYNSKELVNETGNYDYGWRRYDPAIARWNSIDPLAENYFSISPAAYVANNPIKFVDPDGRWVDIGSQSEWSAHEKAIKAERDELSRLSRIFGEAKGENAREMYRLTSRRSEILTESLKNLKRLWKSTIQGYSLNTIEVGSAFGGLSYDKTTKNIVIGYDGTTESFIHEVTHVDQFTRGDIAFDKNTGKQLLVDINDEIESYLAQYAYDPSTTHGIKRASDITAQWVLNIPDENGQKKYGPGTASNTSLIPLDVNSTRAEFIKAFPNSKVQYPEGFSVKKYWDIIYRDKEPNKKKKK